ncbi:UNVERIFIED_CONTAM: hypothetical protein GTU68_050635 [Idotea baltica]|nr:hypothetical protein [Idotea baltica]
MPIGNNPNIAVIGLGYVGLPLAVEFGKVLPTIGFDLDQGRINELEGGHDRTLEVSSEDLAEADQLTCTADVAALKACNVFIVAVPTPIDAGKTPDLTPLRKASHTVGSVLGEDDIVIYESTVFPGATEEVCVPILEEVSGLTFNRDFYVGYSPERINPGDHEHRLTDILKVTSGSTPEIATVVDDLYRRIIRAGTYKAPSIKVAEAAKVIENTQRDLNIALINELAMIFDRAGIDTLDVLEAAATKWNFLPFFPGLVGGHCIGVDPYYLTHKSIELGYYPEVVLAGRRINDRVGSYVAERVIRLMIDKDILPRRARALVMGLTFKEDCPDLRNTRVIDIVAELKSYGMAVDVCDPQADPDEAKAEHGVELVQPEAGTYDAIVLAVAHSEYRAMSSDDIRAIGKPGSVIFDVKGALDRNIVDGRL